MRAQCSQQASVRLRCHMRFGHATEQCVHARNLFTPCDAFTVVPGRDNALRVKKSIQKCIPARLGLGYGKEERCLCAIAHGEFESVVIIKERMPECARLCMECVRPVPNHIVRLNIGIVGKQIQQIDQINRPGLSFDKSHR